MTAAVGDLAAGLSAALLASPYKIRSTPYLADTFTPPIALVGIQDIDYHGAFGSPSLGMYNFTVYLILSRANDRAAIAQMEGYMSMAGNSSIKAALETDGTLGGIASGVIVKKSGPPVSLSIGQSQVVYISVPFEVEVYCGP